MAGQVRPKCANCGKYFKYDWDSGTFYPVCDCPLSATLTKEG